MVAWLVGEAREQKRPNTILFCGTFTAASTEGSTKKNNPATHLRCLDSILGNTKYWRTFSHIHKYTGAHHTHQVIYCMCLIKIIAYYFVWRTYYPSKNKIFYVSYYALHVYSTRNVRTSHTIFIPKREWRIYVYLFALRMTTTTLMVLYDDWRWRWRSLSWWRWWWLYYALYTYIKQSAHNTRHKAKIK